MLREPHSTTVREIDGLWMRWARRAPRCNSSRTGADGRMVAPMSASRADLRMAMELISITLPG
jgi:hypothetical protein